MQVAEKQELVNNFLTKLPQDNQKGSAQHFMFEKSYTLLVLYNLIQFRNYQASNFNIINLLFATYIVEKYLCRKFAKSLKTMNNVIQQNFLALDKTDEVELFFGKVGNNKIAEPDSLA
jgi:hypothetical protein